MNIVITDGFTLNPGDLSWNGIEQYGSLTIYDRTPVDTIVERCVTADIVLTNKVPFDSNTINNLPELKMIGVTATGYNIVDTSAALNKGIAVYNVPAYGTASVAQHTFALLLELTNGTGIHAAAVSNGAWEQCNDFSFTKTPLIELAGKTLGVVGFGNIGEQVALIATAFGMKVLYHNPSRKDAAIAQYADMETVFAASDVVTLHCPLKEDSYGLVNKALLQLMKPSAFLINTARGQLINEHDLADALNNGILAGAALDVLSAEPPSPANPLLTAKNCIITPHIAWVTKEARARIMDITAKNIAAFLDGKAANRVN